MPNSAKIRMNRNNKNSSEIIERILFSNEMTKLRSDAQYLVTLNMRSRRSERRTEMPKDWSGSMYVQNTSITLPTMTRQSNLLKEDWKYWLVPRPYILRAISNMNKPRNKNSE
jgi:hypothetical protein